MTHDRDFDRMTRAWLDLMPDEVPDRVIADVLQAVEGTSQVRRPFGAAFRRSMTMNRSYAAVAVAATAVLVGAALLFRPTSDSAGPPTPSPAQTTASATATPTLRTTLVSAPEALRSTWLAYADAAASPGSAARILRLVVSVAGDRVSLFDAGVEMFASSPIAGPSAEFDLISPDGTGGCQVGDLGRYGFAFGSDGTLPGSDGTQLSVSVISDTCTARAAMLGRTWVHALDANSKGGRGVIAAFTPGFRITLPAADYIANGPPGAVSIVSASPDRTLVAVLNPVGWTGPCSATGGSKRPIAPTIEAFSAYMRTLPGFTVKSSNLTIDGHRAVLLVVPSIATADCASHIVNEWTVGAAVEPPTSWFLRQGDTDVIYLVDVDGKLVLLQWLGAGVSRAEERALLATVRFTNSPATAP